MKTLEELIEIMTAKSEALADARNHESVLEDNRGLVKEIAIIRIMRERKMNSTPAEKIVESDEEYAAHREKQRAAVVARFRAEAEYKAACAQVTRASLITPGVAELTALVETIEGDLHRANLQNRELAGYLETKEQIITRLRGDIAQLSIDLGKAKRATDLKEIALRRANSMLADRIRDVEEFDRQKRRFSELVVKVGDALTADDVETLWKRAAGPPPNVLGIVAPTSFVEELERSRDETDAEATALAAQGYGSAEIGQMTPATLPMRAREAVPELDLSNGEKS